MDYLNLEGDTQRLRGGENNGGTALAKASKRKSPLLSPPLN